MRLKLIKKINESPDVKSFFWEAEEKVNWKAGQYFYYTLPRLNYPDERGETRHFTISNSPTEKVLRLTTKFPDPTSGFKKTLDELKIGDEIKGRGPTGTFTPKSGLFIAGGIGITPFRSIIKYCVDRNLNLPHLIYSNSDENFVFKDELKSWLGKKAVFFDSSVSGHINQLKIAKFIKNWELNIGLATFYVVGPPPFVDAMEEILQKLDIMEHNILTEKFTGY